MTPLVQKTMDFIKPFEGLSLKAYQDIVKVWTIAWGYTKGVKKGMTVTPEQADELLSEEVSIAYNSLHRLTIVPLNDNQAIALTDFIYNLGSGAFQRSTLRMKLNRGEFESAAKEILKWNKADGVAFKGLTRRRVAEFELYTK